MKISVIGCGYMGRIYVKNLLESFGFMPDDIVVYDIKAERMQEMVDTFGVVAASSLEEAVSEVVIVATNTPSHVQVIKVLSAYGTKFVFCEKPLGMNSGEVESLRELPTVIFTAFLINFSPALRELKKLAMKDITTVLREGSVTWGKNRFGNARPTPGDLEDEAIHGFAALLQLIQTNGSVIGTTVAAHLTFMDYADAAVQSNARKQDASFPQYPNSSSFIVADVQAGDAIRDDMNFYVPIGIHSSYIMPEQVRRIAGIFGNTPVASSEGKDAPMAGFSIDFDVRSENGGTKDILKTTDIRSGETVTQEFAGNKITLELEAFLHVARGGEADSRLTTFEEVLRLVKFADAVGCSSREGGRLMHAFGYHGSFPEVS